MKSADYWVEHLQLAPHPEGGFYKETYRATEMIATCGLPDRFEGVRSFSTAIYFLLRSQDRSVFHRIKSDELWHFYSGTSLQLHVLQNGKLQIYKLGPDPTKGESLQLAIPANCWFGAHVEQPDSYTLSGCTVAPGFDFKDFEMAHRDDLITEYPQYREIIMKLT